MPKKLYLALVTPFTQTNDIDVEALKQLTLQAMKEGVEGFVVCGTTAESPTLTENEKLLCLETVLSVVENQAVYFGIGSNNTCESMRLLKLSEDLNFEGYLIVTPYYNLPTQYGLYEHFATLASETKKKIILYNVPKRCTIALQANTILKLIHDFPNVTALKQASNDFETVKTIHKSYPDFEVFCGDDGLILEGLVAGECGVISVLAHLYAPMIKDLLSSYSAGYDVNCQMSQLKDIASILFMESNPICIKYALSKQGRCLNILRLPMCSVSEQTKEAVDQLIDN